MLTYNEFMGLSSKEKKGYKIQKKGSQKWYKNIFIKSLKPLIYSSLDRNRTCIKRLGNAYSIH